MDDSYINVTCEDCGYVGHNVIYVSGLYLQWECPRCGWLAELDEVFSRATGDFGEIAASWEMV